MWEMNTLAGRCYLEHPARAAQHERAEQKHAQKKGSLGRTLVDLMQVLGAAFTPGANDRTKPR